MKSLFFLISFLIVTSLANAQSLEYGYVFIETTGITHHILKDGKNIPIQFSSDSNQEQLRMLNSLKWSIIYPNSAGNKIFLRGILIDNVKKTPEKSNMAKSETYHDFKLISWYIKTPFMEMEIKDINMVPHEFIYKKRNMLKKTDFNELANNLMNLSEFQR